MRTRRIGGLAGFVAAGVALALLLGLAAPQTPSAPAQNSCVACHTSKTFLEPLVPPLPQPPAEGEG